jgi:opacity protein-like surface antigen
MRHFLIGIVLLLPLTAQAGQHLIVPTLGVTSWSDETGHLARGTTLNFEDDNSLTLGAKYLYMFDSGIALGGNAYFYGKDVLNPVQADDAGVVHVHGLVEYIFTPGSDVMPFIGLGIGFSSIGFSGGVLDDESSAGESYELNGGVIFKLSETIGIQLEYKYIDFDIDDDIDGLNTEINTDAHSFLLGVSIHL